MRTPHWLPSGAVAAALLSGATGPLAAQAPTPIEIGGVTMSGSLRTRVEAWNWFGDDPNGRYTYPGSLFRVSFSRSKPKADWQVELAVPFLLGLPDHAVVAGAQGALGMGGNYYAANDNSVNAASIFVKQAFVRLKRLGGVDGQSLKIGRMEFVDGTETSPKPATLAALKRDRIGSRLLGTFAFTHVGRSADGAVYALDLPTVNVTLFGGRATQGVFQTDGWRELDVALFYGAITSQTGPRASPGGEWRLFGLAYHDGRTDLVKVDNRGSAARRVDTEAITLGTFGGHYLRAVPTAAGPVDLLVWGAGQIGSWGQLAHRASALSAEAGWQPEGLPALAPWIRGGLDWSSGDGDANDTRHGTFFLVLPTPRPYARFPFFNMMNTSDAFAELIIRPSSRLTIRTDVHSLRLASTDDLWYQGGGAFQPSTFGYAGRPSNGQAALATLYDASGDFVVNTHVSVGLYYGYAAAAPVTQAIYGGNSGGQFAYLELLLRF